MKLSLSTYGWSDLRLDDFTSLAREMGMTGIEIHDLFETRFTGPGAPFSADALARTVRALTGEGIRISCVDARVNCASATGAEEAYQSIARLIDAAALLRSPFVRLKAVRAAGATAAEEDGAVSGLIARVLPLAEKAGVTLLMETAGIYADTGRLARVLNAFASDSLAALWDVHHPYRFFGETPEKTVTNLGAYIRHIHLKDSTVRDGEVRYCLLGEGDLPVKQVFDAMRSISYEGFYCLEWNPAWQEALRDPGLIYGHFVSIMSRYEPTLSWQTRLYSSRDGAGKYVWKQDTLIDLTFPQVLDRMAREFPDQLCFRFPTLNYTRTYAQFLNDVDEFARALIAMGVKRGSHVSVWATNVPEWYIAFWAVTKIGAALVTMNTAYKIAEAEYLLRQSDTHTLIMIDRFRDSDYVEIMQRLCPELRTTAPGEALHASKLPFLRNVITVGFRMPGGVTWEEALSRAPSVPIEEVYRRSAEMRGDDVANMQYTSGTTGFPKGVMLTHRGVINNGKCIGDRMDLSTADRMMIQVPMFHCFGMVLAMTACMTHGVTMYPLPYFSPKPALNCIHQEKITCFHGVPTMFIAMLSHPDFAKTDFSHMRTGIMAGSNCPPSVMREAAEKMRMTGIVSVFGQTESSPGCTMSRCYDDSLTVRTETVGCALPEVECKIIDPATGRELPDGEQGEFVARGYNIMKGYYKMPSATTEAIDEDGWLHTGDLCVRDADRNFRVTGRLRDMIIRGGENIYPREIEEFLYTHPKIKDVQVIGVPDKQYGEEIMACVIVKDNETLTEEEVKDYVRKSMARHKTPKYVWFMESFIMNDAGKIQKFRMTEKAIEKFGLTPK